MLLIVDLLTDCSSLAQTLLCFLDVPETTFALDAEIEGGFNPLVFLLHTVLA